MRYFVVESNTKSGLTTEVERMLKEGWRLQGSVSIAIDQGQCSYAQALTKG